VASRVILMSCVGIATTGSASDSEELRWNRDHWLREPFRDGFIGLRI